MSDHHDLAEIPLFIGLSSEELARIAMRLRRTVYPPRATIISADDEGDELYIVQEGTVKISVDQPEGDGVTLAILGPGELVGELAAVQRDRRSATVTALERTTLLRLSHDHFAVCLREIPPLALNLIVILGRRLRLANAQILSFATQNVDERLPQMLLTFAREHGHRRGDGAIHIPLRLTQSDLADLVGASRISVNRVIADYKKAGIIAIDSHYQITILDIGALRLRERER